MKNEIQGMNMKKPIGSLKTRSMALVCVVSLLPIQGLMVGEAAYADLIAPPPQSNTETPELNVCNDVCGRLSELDRAGGGSGASNSIGGPKSEAWCIMHGAGPGSALFTGSGGGAVTVAPPSAGALPGSTGSSSCIINGVGQTNSPGDSANPAAAGDVTTADGCAQRARMINACGWLKNSQLVNYCKAFQAVRGDGVNKGAKVADGIIAALDAAAGATCLAECIQTSGAGSAACAAAGAAVGITEMAEINAQAGHSSVAKYINTVASGLNVAGAGVVGATAITAGLQGGAAQGSSLQTANGAAACVMSALFAVQMVVRLVDMVAQQSAADGMCDSIRELLSGEGTAGEGGGGSNGGDGSGGGGFYAGGPGGAATSSPYASGGGNGGAASDPNAYYNQCSNNGANPAGCAGVSSSEAAASSAAKDAEWIKKAPGLVPPRADMKDLIAAAMKGDAGGLMAAAMPATAGDAGAALAKMASDLQKNPSELAALGFSLPKPTYASGGGGGGSGAKAADNPFANLFGAGAGKEAGGRGPSAETFGKTKTSDIWHTGTSQNIFQIVSEKLEKVADRVFTSRR